MDYLLHFLIGLLGMGAGFVARSWCQHIRHQVMVGFILLVAESYVTVRLVG